MSIKLRYSFVLLFLLATSLYGHTEVEKDTLVTHSSSLSNASVNQDQFFHFPELDKQFPILKKYNVVSESEFTFSRIKKEFPQPIASINNARNEAEAGFREIDSTGRWIASFSNENIQVLPVGIKHKLNEVEYQIGFTKARFAVDYTELTVFVKVILPQSDEKGLPIELFFGANNVKLSHQGGIIGDANLVLLGDIFIPFNSGNWLLILKGGFDYKTGDTVNRTYVTIGCDGVKEMGIEGEVQFSRNMLLPVDIHGNPLAETRPYLGATRETIQIPNRVTGAFKAVASDWNDLIVEISLSPFVLASQPDKFMFSVNQAVFDFSDLRTENVNFPQHYYDNGLLLPNEDAWRGVYVQSLQVGLPQEFKTKESIPKRERVSFEAANLLIDSYGVSGYFSAKNLIPLDSGRTSESKAWAYSVDQIGIELAANRLVGAHFEGRLVLPVSKKSTNPNQEQNIGLAYNGIISEEEYALRVSNLNTLNFDVFKAKAQLLPNSSIELAVIDGSFRPKAILNGRMAINASQRKSLEEEGQEYTTSNANGESEKHMVQFKGIEFQNLVIQTVSPVIKVDYFGYKDEVKLANFPVSIANIEFMANDYEAGLAFDLKINLMGKKDKGFAADANIGIFGKFHEEQYRQKWKFDRLTLSKVIIDADMGGLSIKGGLDLMDNDPIYGDGFSAFVEAKFGDNFGPIRCKAIFGKKEFRYWYVDAAVEGLEIQAGPLQISGFAGGAFYHMSRRPNAGPDFSPSGLSYIPNKNSNLGVKAMLMGGIPDDKAIAISAGFEIEFNRNYGINRMGLFGEAQIMKAFNFPNPTEKLSKKLSAMVDTETMQKAVDSKAGKVFLEKATHEYEPEIVGKAGITAELGMEYDFVNNSFHADLNIYVSVAGGVIQGRASRGRAGWGVVHIAPDEWYVHMGTPTDRLGLKMGIGSFSVETGGYFMVGDRIPGSPPPPTEVAEILGVEAETLNYMRDENALGEGRGFAFGTDFKVDTGDINFLILYARFKAGVGFDIMVKDYGNAKCVNTGDKIGINGWYANGQAYAYLQGELGINIKLFFVRKKIPIIKGGAAILMQAKGPNPFWMRGYAAGYYDLLGGLVKGSYRLKVSLGEECVLDNASPLGGVKMITDLTPKDEDKDVDVFAAPQAAFAMKVNQPIVIPEDEGDKYYKVILEKFDVLDASGKKIVGELEWGYMNDRVTFVSEDILPPNAKLKAIVEVSSQERINGVYQTILEDGQKAIEKEERNFVTGGAPDHIPLRNIEYAYPVVDQHHFYKGEYPKGYIQLQRGQDYLFDTKNWKSRVKYIDENGSIAETTMSYDQGKNKVVYQIPKVDKETKYVLSIISTPKSRTQKTDTRTRSDVQDYGDNNTVEVQKNKAINVLKEGEIDRLSYDFRSSAHHTFAQKIKAAKISSHNVGKINSDVVFLFNMMDSYEGFDIVELLGTEYSDDKPLISRQALLTDKYFKHDINPILYARYPIGGKYRITRRDVKELGVPPRKALPIDSRYLTSLEENTNLNLIRTNFPYRYNLGRVYKEDFVDMRDQVYSDYVSGVINASHPAMSLTEAAYYFMRYGKYEIKLQYTLPGGISGSEVRMDFKNTLEFRK